ncbi:unnamed protein product [Somion occarium]|uniref:Protein root UVB sensitive/RUS domain-containing protein n=1 Tax=Somion occarium TaxID=3059160 RepID=A0ABP1DNJ3_9APHY
MSIIIRESDDSGRNHATYIQTTETIRQQQETSRLSSNWVEFFRGIFLPAGYPATVSPDYLQCQIYYGVQAFCSSLAGLIASRAVLEGHGIGKADASATDAMLLTLLQDAFSRLTTILGAYYLGTSLYPEAKTYRLVADIANDVAIVLDLLSPQLSTYSLSLHYPFITSQSSSALRTAALCSSGGFRALCGVAAGGSRAALTLHFAQDGSIPGDVGDLSAKDASKETVLALIGMLVGSLIIPHLHTAQATYTVVCILLIGHLLANYIAVRVVIMKALNRQRAAILWTAYRETTEDEKGPCRRVLMPKEVAKREYLFGRENALLNIHSHTDEIAGYATIGSSFSDLFPSSPLRGDATWTSKLLDVFADEKFIVWFDLRPSIFSIFPLSLVVRASPKPRFHILLKEGHTSTDHLKAWAFTCDLASFSGIGYPWESPVGLVKEIEYVKVAFDEAYEGFVDDVKRAGWNVDVQGLVSGSPRVISVEKIEHGAKGYEDKKTI